MSIFPSLHHTPGTSPGSLIAYPESPKSTGRFHLIHYNASQFSEIKEVWSEELPNTLPEDQITWIRHSGTTSPEALQRIGERYGVHSLALEDIANVGQRPKMVNYGDAIFVTMVVPRLHNNAILTAQLSLYMKDKLVLSFFEGGEDFFRSILDRLAQDKGRLRGAGPDYLVYRLVDLAVDLIYPILQQSAEELEELELRPLDVDQDDSLNTLYTIRRQLAVLGRYVGPQQELVQNLIDEEAHLIGGECSVFLGDTLDHLQHLLDVVHTQREFTVNSMEAHWAYSNMRMNEVVRVLTVISTVFLPLNFLVGVYGMNFSNPNSPYSMPELQSYFGYPLVLLAAATVASTMLIIFKRKGWF